MIMIFYLIFVSSMFVFAYSSQTYDFLFCLVNFQQQELASHFSRALTHRLQQAESLSFLIQQAGSCPVHRPPTPTADDAHPHPFRSPPPSSNTAPPPTHTHTPSRSLRSRRSCYPASTRSTP